MDKESLERINKTGDFLHKAFCVDGETKFVKITEPTPEFNCNGMLFQIDDEKRGMFFVAIYRPIN